MANNSPYVGIPILSRRQWEREVAFLRGLHDEEKRREAYVRECQRQEAVQHATAPPPPRVPRTMDEAYAWLLRGRDVAPEDMRRLIRAEDEAREKEARERREAEWPLGDWGLSYQGEDRVKTASESLGE